MKHTAIMLASLSHHLRIAAEQYGRDAAELQAVPNPNGASKRLAEQFERQQAECRAWADVVDNCDEAELMDDVLILGDSLTPNVRKAA